MAIIDENKKPARRCENSRKKESPRVTFTRGDIEPRLNETLKVKTETGRPDETGNSGAMKVR